MSYDLCSGTTTPDPCAEPAPRSYVPTDQAAPNIRDLSFAVAPLLPGKWTPEPAGGAEDADDLRWKRSRGELTNENGAQVHLSYDSYKKRIHVGCVFPRDDHNSAFGPPYGTPAPSITVSPLKTAEQVAKDIKRRVLPEYLPLWTAAIENKNKWLKREVDADDFARELAGVLGVEYRGKGRNGYGDERRVGHFKVSPYDCTAKLEVDLPREKALAIARLLGKEAE